MDHASGAHRPALVLFSCMPLVNNPSDADRNRMNSESIKLILNSVIFLPKTLSKCTQTLLSDSWHSVGKSNRRSPDKTAGDLSTSLLRPVGSLTANVMILMFSS